MNNLPGITIVCLAYYSSIGVFVANISDNDVGRYRMRDDGSYIMMLDTKLGDLYVHGPTDKNGEKWAKLKEIVN